MKHTFDHLVLGISDLERGSARVEELTGVRPTFSGNHPHTGTHNALASLGGTRYLEVVAPRADSEPGVSPLAAWLATLEQLTPILWAVATSDSSATRARLEEAGFVTSEPSPGSRKTPDGDVLEWTTFGLSSPQLAAAPFFIQWGKGTRHPASTSPGGCELREFRLTSDDNEAMRRLLDLLGIAVTIVDGGQPGLVAELDCPVGPVVLSAPTKDG